MLRDGRLTFGPNLRPIRVGQESEVSAGPGRGEPHPLGSSRRSQGKQASRRAEGYHPPHVSTAKRVARLAAILSVRGSRQLAIAARGRGAVGSECGPRRCRDAPHAVQPERLARFRAIQRSGTGTGMVNGGHPAPPPPGTGNSEGPKRARNAPSSLASSPASLGTAEGGRGRGKDG